MNRIRDWRYVWETQAAEDGTRSRVLVKRVRLPDALLRSIVYLFRSREEAERLENPGGSGFIVSFGSPDERGARYVVTNGHVVGRENCVIRLNALQGGRPVIIERAQHDWVRHWDGDLAVTFLELAAGEGMYGYRAVPSTMILTDEINREHDFGIGDQAFMMGLFAGYYGAAANRVLPAVRYGNVSMMPEQTIKRPLPDDTTIDEESFLVEMYSMGGFSGSPVFVRRSPVATAPAYVLRDAPGGGWEWSAIEDVIFLLGINWGHLPERLPVQRKGNEDRKEGLEAVGNHSIGCVVPARKLAELLMDSELVEQREAIMEEDKRTGDRPSTETGGVPDSLPFPGSGFTPGLQRTLKDKLDQGEIDEVDEDAFLGSMRRAVPPETPPEQDGEAP